MSCTAPGLTSWRGSCRQLRRRLLASSGPAAPAVSGTAVGQIVGQQGLHGIALLAMEAGRPAILPSYPRQLCILTCATRPHSCSAGTQLRESCIKAECLLLHGALLTGSVAAAAVLLDLAPPLAAAAGIMAQQDRSWAEADSCERLDRLLALPPLRGSIRASTGQSVLHWAAAGGSAAAVQRCLAAAPQLATAACKAGRLPLHLAVAAGDARVLRLLLQAAPQAAAAMDASGRTPLAAAVASGNGEAAELLLAAHPSSLPASSIGGKPLLHWCVRNGRHGMAARLLALAPTAARMRAPDGTTALHQAAAKRDTTMLQMLVAACPVAAAIPDSNGMLPIHAAALEPALAAAVGCLLAAAPTTAMVAYYGSLPLHLAASVPGMAAVVDQLLKTAPRAATAVDDQGNVPLHHAVTIGDAAIVQQLVAAAPGAVNVPNGQLRTPVAACVLCRRTDILNLLLRAVPTAATALAALELAISHFQPWAVECLLAVVPSAASTVLSHDTRQTMLHFAAEWGSAPIISALVKADPAAAALRDAYGHTPFSLAASDAAMSPLIPFTPASEVLQRLRIPTYPDPWHYAPGVAVMPQLKFDLICECVAAHIPLTSHVWALVPANCRGLGRVLPRAVAISAQQARSLVAHMPGADRERLRLFALCLHRALRRLHIYIPSEVFWHILSLFDA